MSRILRVGMVQQSCGTDIAANIAKLEKNIRECAAFAPIWLKVSQNFLILWKILKTLISW